MEKPNWKELNRFLELLKELDGVLTSVIEDEARQVQEIREAYISVLEANAIRSLSQVPVDELKKSKAGIRTAALYNAGFQSLSDLVNAPDAAILAAEGVGEKQVMAIRNIVAEFMKNMMEYANVRISPDDESEQNLHLLLALSRYRMGQRIRAAAEPHVAGLHAFVLDIDARLLIRNGFRWVFSGRRAKESTAAAYREMKDFFRSEEYAEIEKLVKMYRQASEIGTADARVDFSRNAADFYAMLEAVNGAKISKSLVYSSIPEQLAAEIDDTPLDLRDFSGTLRAYQTFGTKYILHQGRVLLGDEMGLGKTVQAIAAMSHICAQASEFSQKGDVPSAAIDQRNGVRCPNTARFLIICPASVLANWCREIRKFSRIPVHLLHGALLEDAFTAWLQTGGAAVTNYESMGKIIDRIDEVMHLDMLIIDEAHYIKNPGAKRTAYIRRLDNESDRILLMTGTPVENRVSEMCSLIDFIRPDMAEEIRMKAYMSAVPEFREMLSPIYLRRQRDMVLDELPPIEEMQEWCSLNPADLASYAESVSERNFAAMRRVGFHLEDASMSCKGVRLAELCEEAKAEGRKVIVYSYFRETVRRVYELLKEDCAGVITGSTAVAERQEIIDRFTGTGETGTGAETEAMEPDHGFGVAAPEEENDGYVCKEEKENGEERKQGIDDPAGKTENLPEQKNCNVRKAPEGTGDMDKNILICQIQAGGTGLNIQAASIVIFCEPQIKPSLAKQAISRVYRMGQVRNVLVYHLLCENTVDEAVMGILEEKQREFDLYADESAMADATEGLFDREWIRQYMEKERRKYLPAVL